jgi:integrase
VPKITKRVVDASSAKAKRYIVWDSELKGFGLLVLPTGIKSYIFNYRTPEGRERRITIGKHGTWTPAQARDKAEQYRQAIRTGGDPLGEKRLLAKAATVGDLLNAYLASETFRDKAPSTQAVDHGRIERHLRPLLGKRHAHLLTENDIRRALAAIRDGKTAADIKTRKRGRARVKGGAGTARMAIDLLRAIFNFGISERLVKTNPCAGVKTGSSGTRETILDDAGEYARLFATLDRMEQERRIRAPVADAIRLIALTGCRRGEAAGLKWAHVDLEHGKLVLPPTSHKTGRKTGKPRIIALPATAQAIIARQPEGEPADLVFTPTRGSNALALSKAWRKVRAEADLPADIGLHGLRHSLASHMAMAGAQAPEIMQVVGHRQLSTVVRYLHWAETAQAALAERAASVPLAGMAAASNPKGKVVRLKGGER